MTLTIARQMVAAEVLKLRRTRALARTAGVLATPDLQGGVESATGEARPLERSESARGLVDFAPRRSRSRTGTSSRLCLAARTNQDPTSAANLEQ